MNATFKRTLLAGLAGLALSASSGAFATAAWAETTLTRGMGSTIGTLDPHINFLTYEGFIQDDMYEGLVSPDAAGMMVPGAAEKWEMSDDGLTYTFHLREGLTWSNGDKLVAQDFVNGVVRTLDPATASDKGYIFTSTISVVGAAAFNAGENKDPASVGLSAPDDRTVVIKLDKPAPYAIYLFNSYYMAPFHKPSFDKFGGDFIKPENIVSNGAYHMSENVPQSHVTLVKSPTYWGAADVQIDKVIYQITEDDSTAVKLFKAGEQDITYDIPGPQLEALQAELGDQVSVSSSTETDYLSFNITQKPLDDIRVREALALALDRDTMINKVVKGGYIYNCGYVIPVPDYPQPQQAPCTMEKDARIAKAKELYAAAGFSADNPLSLTIESSNNDAYKKMAETAAVMWKQTLGVDAKVNAQDRDAWLAAFNAGTWQVFMDNLVGDFAGPETYLAYIDPRAEAGYNWQSEEYQQLYDQAMSTPDQAGRYKLLAEAEMLFLNTYITVPLGSAPNRSLINPRVKGWVENPAGWHSTKLLRIE